MRLFLSYRAHDRKTAEVLASRLGAEHHDCFLAPWSLRAGAFWLPALAAAIAEAEAFILLLTKGGPGPWQIIEYYEAFDRKGRCPDFPLIPLLLPGAEPRLPFLRQLHWIEAADPVSTETLRSLSTILRGTARPALPQPLWRSRIPYRGFNSLGEEDADFFFGREQDTAAALDHLCQGCRSLMFVGNSGVGKSSLVDAGLVAALRRQRSPDDRPWPGELAESRKWLFLPLRLGDSPLLALSRAFVSLWREPEDPERVSLSAAWAKTLRKEGLYSILSATRDVLRERMGAEAPERFVLVLNQGEELYPSRRTDDSLRISTLIAEALRLPDVAFIGSLRSDHYGRFQEDRDLFPESVRLDVEPLWSVEQMRAVIERPAAALGVRCEPASAAADIAEEAAQTAALPLLCYLLEEMWRRMQQRADGLLRWEDYSALRGVRGVLASRFADYLGRHGGRSLHLQRLMTLRLARVARGREISRRLAYQEECTPEEWAHVEVLAGQEWRLIVTGEEAGRPTAEVAHEAVLRSEGPVLRWLRDDSQFLEWKWRLEEERRLWEEKGRAAEWLLDGGRLKEFQQQIGKRRGDLGMAEAAYLAHCEGNTPGRQRRARLLAAGGVLLVVALAIIAPRLARERGFRRHERASKALVACGAQVRSLSDGSTEVEFFPDRAFRPSCIGLLSDLRDLRSVDLSEMNVSSEDVQPLAGLSGITTLNLADTRISDAGLAIIGRLPALNDLNLSSCDVHLPAVLSLPHPGRFKRLTLDKLQLGREGLDGLEHFTQLDYLSLTGTQLTNPELSHMAALGHLKELYLDVNPQISGDGLSVLRQLRDLSGLSLSGDRLDDAQVERMKLPLQIRRLDLSNCRITGSSLRALAGLVELRTLNLSFNPVEERFLDLLSAIPKLDTLEMKAVHLTDAGLMKLCRLHQLRELSVPVNGLSDRGFSHIPELTRLTTLYAGGTALDDAGLTMLAAMPSLQKLQIPGVKITTGGLYGVVRAARGHLRVLVEQDVFAADDLQRASRGSVSFEEVQ